MKIGIVGSGKIGGTIGSLWAQAGHEVFFSSRHPSHLAPLVQKLREEGHEAHAGKVDEAVRFGEVILFSPPFSETDAALDLMGPTKDELEGKLVIDATNPFAPDGLELALPMGTTAASELIKKIPKSQLVKAFNTVYWQTLRDLNHEPFESRYVICYAGNNDMAKETVSHLIEDAGFISFDLGPINNAVLMEPGGPFFNQELTLTQAEHVLDSIGRQDQEVA